MTARTKSDTCPNPQKARQSLVAEIQALFENGLRLTREDARFLDSTLGHADAACIRQAIREDTDGMSESLLEFFFTPDLDVRLRMEPLLHLHAFEAADEDRLFDDLRPVCTHARFLFPDGRAPLCLEIPDACLRLFISRLRIGRQLPGDLKTAVEAHVDAETAPMILVKLRSVSFDFHPPFIGFLAKLIEALPSKHPLFQDCLNFCLDGRAELHKTMDVSGTLTRLAERNRTILRQSAAQEADLAGRTMELRMLQGIHPPLVNRGQLLIDLRSIETIREFVFGCAGGPPADDTFLCQDIRTSPSGLSFSRKPVSLNGDEAD